MASFNLDDIVQLTPADKKHPAIADGSNGYGRIVQTMVNGNPNFYRVAVGNIVSPTFLMEAADLTAYTGYSGHLVGELPPPINNPTQGKGSGKGH